VEEEDNGTLPFLDTLQTREKDGSIKISVYRKPTHTDRYLDYASHHPTQHRNSVVDSLVHRALTIPTTEDDRNAELNHVRKVLSLNGYPKYAVERRVRLKKSRLRDHTPTTKSAEAATNLNGGKAERVTLPYYAGTSEKLSRVFKRHGLDVVYKPVNKLRAQLMKVKDCVPGTEKAGVVYSIRCGDCESTYVGETKRKASTRVKEHQADCRLRRVGNSALVDHVVNTGHEFDFDSTRILRLEQNYRRRIFSEAWHIKKQQDACANKFSGKRDIPDAYLQFCT